MDGGASQLSSDRSGGPVEVGFYAIPGPFTRLTSEQAELVGRLGPGLGPVDLCRVAQGLLSSSEDAFGAGLSEQRLAERGTRPAADLLRRIVELDPATPLDRARPPELRVVGTCRHFATLATSLLRASGIPARARCGFAAYFVPPRKVDHWIVESWSAADSRWVRIDPEYLDRATPGPARPHDLRADEFLTAGEAWELVRSGDDDASRFGVHGTENWGAGEIRGNVLRDLASLAAKIEVLPWDEWGPMADSYAGTTGDDFDATIDAIATAGRRLDHPELLRHYDEFPVPAAILDGSL